MVGCARVVVVVMVVSWPGTVTADPETVVVDGGCVVLTVTVVSRPGSGPPLLPVAGPEPLTEGDGAVAEPGREAELGTEADMPAGVDAPLPEVRETEERPAGGEPDVEPEEHGSVIVETDVETSIERDPETVTVE